MEEQENLLARLIETHTAHVMQQLEQAKGNESLILRVHTAGFITLLEGLACATQDPHQMKQHLKAYVINELDKAFTSIIT